MGNNLPMMKAVY